MERPPALPHNTSSGLEASISSLNSVDHDNSATSSANVDTQPSRWTSAATSVTASPLVSREPSPIRAAVAKTPRARRSSSSTRPSSRKNSIQDPSPSRSRAYGPTSTPKQHQQLSAATTPTLPPPTTSETVLRAPVPQKPSVTAESSRDAPKWPVSPRLKSPPPILNKPAVPTTRRGEQEPPSINVQRATPSPHPQYPSESSSQAASDAEGDEAAHQHSGMRTPARGPSGASSTLETVQEVSQPSTPGPNLELAIEKLSQPGVVGGPHIRSDTAVNRAINKSGTGSNSESGSESGSVKASTRRSSTPAPPLLHNRQSSSTLRFGGKGGETSSKHITVEEEEVNSMPRVNLGLNPPAKEGNHHPTLKTKQSSETIRPRREKKKSTRKAPTSGTASSKADIFEAKVASAVEENDSSDSDETFVYDSNPPDANDRPRRYHSRTPSATSMASQVDRNGLRSIHSMLDSGPVNPAIKKNMKFVNTYSSGADSMAGDDDGKGTGGRSNVGSARALGRHHHGRFGRNNNGSHLSIFDNESPFPNAARSKLSGHTSRQSSQPPSPRFPPARGGIMNSKRQMAMTNGYDLDDTTTGADDERTPLLMNGNRSIRSHRGRRGGYRERGDLESHSYRSRPSFLNRFASCLVLTIMLLLVIMGAVGFMFATSQPLTDIKLVKIGNVLASQQELMMDITVRAHNPNIVVVSIDSADLEVFAKSPHAGTDSEWWRRPDDGMHMMDDPPNDQPGDSPDDEKAPNMRLGNIVELDSPLSFEGSFFQSGNSMSSGELRLKRPGNGTDGGTERWERILQDEFTLILKGVLKYSLPLSQKIRSVAISGRTTVKPNSVNDPVLKPNGTTVEIGIS